MLLNEPASSKTSPLLSLPSCKKISPLLSGRVLRVETGGAPSPFTLTSAGIENDMRRVHAQIKADEHRLKMKGLRIVLSLLAVNAIAVALLFYLSSKYPSLVSAGFLALSFGLRHAVDADHIAAIDNVTRRLMSDGKQPLLVGLWFSLGHSSVVGLICIATACGAEYLQHSSLFEGVGAVISSTVSATVLLLIGVANLVSICVPVQEHEHSHDGGVSLVTRCCPVVLRAIDSEWKMFLLGFGFGLGFETSSEVALLALAAMSPAQGIPPSATLILPLLFASGMSLIDTLDGLLMSWAYGSAANKEAAGEASSRLSFSLFLTISSSAIAIGIGVVELLGVAQHQLKLRGPFWQAVASVNDHFEVIGYSIIAFFVVSLLAAAVAWRCCRAAPATTHATDALEGGLGGREVQRGRGPRAPEEQSPMPMLSIRAALEQKRP